LSSSGVLPEADRRRDVSGRTGSVKPLAMPVPAEVVTVTLTVPRSAAAGDATARANRISGAARNVQARRRAAALSVGVAARGADARRGRRTRRQRRARMPAEAVAPALA
jgi:hypothetical protein